MIEVDLPQLLLGLALFGLVAGWLLLDWHVRSIRSVVLLLAGLGVTVGAGVVLDWPISLVGLLLAGVLVLPVAARHPTVMPLTATDAAMTRRLRRSTSSWYVPVGA